MKTQQGMASGVKAVYCPVQFSVAFLTSFTIANISEMSSFFLLEEEEEEGVEEEEEAMEKNQESARLDGHR
uniref:Uncharacterized protein n=1 Tax=Caenorhabditis japonica TaxID=281687 RepID=A0A8R1ID25_CAEJA